MLVPTAARSGPNFVTERSACGIMIVPVDAVLSARFGSVSAEVTVAVFVIVPVVAPVVL
jgi:hypothetical protein